MAIKVFHGFDFSTTTANAFGGATLAASTVTWTSNLLTSPYRPPTYLYHNKGVATLDRTMVPVNSATNVHGCFWDRNPDGVSYGCAGFSNSAANTVYTGATTVLRATWATAQGHQIGIVRSLVLPTALTATEYWFSFDIIFGSLGGSSLNSAHLPSASWGSVWKWGDLELKCKQTTWISATTHDVVFSVRNNGAEVATVTCPGVIGSTTYGSNTVLPVVIRAKLDATTGLLDVLVNGVAQSASYTGQNTVATTSDAAATAMYFSPPVFDNGTNAYVGQIDNILIDDAAWPAGRPRVRVYPVLSDDTLLACAAAGTSPTTVTNALATLADAKHVRFSATPGRATLNMTTPTTTGMRTTILGVIGLVQGASNRTANNTRKVGAGITLSSVDAEDQYAKAVALPFGSVVTPPETNVAHLNFEIFEKGGGGQFATSDFGTGMDAYIRAV